MKRHAILFGVEKYGPKSGLNPLVCPSRDVQIMKDLLTDPDFGGDPDTVFSHVDTDHVTAERALFRFLRELGRDDVAMIHFSGHGLQDEAGELYLCFTDTDANELEITALAVADIRKMLDSARARKVLMTLDCCYSGRAGEQLARGSVGATLRKVEETFAEGTGVYVLSASGGTQTAKESKSLGAGIFTHHFVEGIRSGKADRDGNGMITVSEMAEYLQSEVPKDAANQKPHLSARGVTGTFVIAENRKLRMGEQIDVFKKKVRALVDAETIGFTFAGEVVDWLKRPEIFNETPGKRWELLQKIDDEQITVGDFQEQWRAFAGKPAKAPEPPPPPPETQKTPQTEHREPETPKADPPWKTGPKPEEGRNSPPETQDRMSGQAPAVDSATRRSLLWLIRMVLSPFVLLALEVFALLVIFITIFEINPYDYTFRTTINIDDTWFAMMFLLALMVPCVLQITINWRHRKRRKRLARYTCIAALIMMALFTIPGNFSEIVRGLATLIY